MSQPRSTQFLGGCTAVCGLLAVLAMVPELRAAERPPNVVLIVADDLGWADLGCYGSKYHQTPQLDALAQAGTRFTHAYAACPVCSPTRAALLTGRYPARLHLTDWLPGRGDRPDQKLRRPAIRQELPLEEVTLAEHFQKAGYATAHIGKWHLGGAGFGPEQQGFGLNIAGDETGTPRSYFAPFENKDRASGAIKAMPGLENSTPGEYLTDRLTTEAEAFLDAHRDRPFFLYMPHYAVHTPLKAKPELIAKRPGEPQHGRQSHPVYAAMLDSLDESVGRILKKLADLKLDGRTIVVFTSDNGGLATLEGMPHAPTINSPLREGKGYLYEGGIRVPLIVRGPGVAPQVSDQAVASYDLLPTLLDLCGLPAPAVDGVSFKETLNAGAPLAERAIYWHYPHYANQGSTPGGAIRRGAYKLVEFYETGRRELYNVQQDVSESKNLSESHADLANDLAAELAKWRADVQAQEMTPNPDYVANPPDAEGVITLRGRSAVVHGLQLRYEPLPHKNTLGFWVRQEDYITWEFTPEPGKYEVAILQGCGKGSGGAVVEFRTGDQALTHTVVDTGHFQNFQPYVLGTFDIKAGGRQTLTIRALTKPGVAVMDLREMTLKRVK